LKDDGMRSGQSMHTRAMSALRRLGKLDILLSPGKLGRSLASVVASYRASGEDTPFAGLSPIVAQRCLLRVKPELHLASTLLFQARDMLTATICAADGTRIPTRTKYHRDGIPVQDSLGAYFFQAGNSSTSVVALPRPVLLLKACAGSRVFPPTWPRLYRLA
jgi:hypothetical protein